MSLMVADDPMAKRQDVSVKISPEALRVAKVASAYEDKSVAEFLSDIVLEVGGAIIERHQKAGTLATKPKAKGSK
jgi:uncharacterized protein (DUF1778 family)